MSIRNILIISTTLILGACGGGKPPAKSPDTTAPDMGGGEAKSSDTPEAGKTADKGEGATKSEEKSEPATAPKLDKPKSDSTIAGKSISEADPTALQAEAKKLGWLKAEGGASPQVSGSYETIKFDIEKGKSKGYVEIVRPAAAPGAASGGGGTPAELKSMREKEGAVHYDEASDVLVVVFVEGKQADAKKLLNQYVKIVKKAAKAEAKAEKTAEKAEKAPKGEKAAGTAEKKAPAPAPAK
jgi:hypothetical protein